MAKVITLGDPNLRQTLEDLKPVTGFCVMADIVGSTGLKDRNLQEWIIRIANTFNLVRSWVEPNFLKTVGDMLMFWFKSEDLFKTSTPLALIDSLASMFAQAKQESEYFHPVKLAVCRCSDVFEISFMRQGEDVYGKDIDLTARLLALAGEGEVLMNEEFRNIVGENYANCANKDQFECVERIQGPWSQKIKGFDKPVTIYKLPAS